MWRSDDVMVFWFIGDDFRPSVGAVILAHLQDLQDELHYPQSSVRAKVLLLSCCSHDSHINPSSAPPQAHAVHRHLRAVAISRQRRWGSAGVTGFRVGGGALCDRPPQHQREATLSERRARARSSRQLSRLPPCVTGSWKRS